MVCVCGVCVMCMCGACGELRVVSCMCVSVCVDPITHKLVEGAHCEGVDVDLTTKDSPEFESGNER